MAVAFGAQNSSFVSPAADGAANLTITKPTGTSSGDMLVFVGICGTSSTFSLSGWTTLFTQTQGTARVTTLFKIAGGSEPASYTFTANSNASQIGSVIRVTGNAFSGVNNFVFDHDGANAFSNPTTYTGGVDPTGTNSLLLIGCGHESDLYSATFGVTNNNPSWTQALERGVNDNQNIYLHWDYAIYSPETATGDYSSTHGNTFSVVNNGFLISIQESTNVTATAGVQSITSSVQAPTVSASANVTVGLNTATFNILTPTVSTQVVDWTYESRPAPSVWTIEDQT